MEVSATADVGVRDRRAVRRSVVDAFAPVAFERRHCLSDQWRSNGSILQDRFDRGIGARIYFQGPATGSFQPLCAMRLGQTHDAHAGPEALFRMIVTAKMNDIDPQARLADVLARMPALPDRR